MRRNPLPGWIVAACLLLAAVPAAADTAAATASDTAAGEQVLREQLREAERRDGPEAAGLAAPLQALAGWLAGQERHAEAVPLWRRAEALLAPQGGEAWAGVLGALAESLAFTGAYAEARPLAQRAVDVLQAAAVPDQALSLALAQHRLADIVQAMGESERAEVLLDSALALRESRLGAASPLVGTTLTARGWSRLQRGNFRGALEDYGRAQAVLEAAGAAHRLDLARVHNDLGTLYENLGDFRQAMPHAERALALREALLGPDAGPVAQSLNNLAGLHEARGEYDRALALYARSLALNERVYGPAHPEVASVLQNYSLAHHHRGDYAEAIALARRALAIDEQAFGPQHPYYALDLLALSATYHELGSHAEALDHAQRALAALQAHYGGRHRRVAHALNNVASLQAAMGRHEAARDTYEQALRMKREVLGAGDPSVAVTLGGLGQLARVTGDLDAAARHFEQALALREAALGPQHVDVAEMLTGLGTVRVHQGDVAAALPLLHRAERVAAFSASPQRQWKAEAGLFEAYLASGPRELAIFWGKRAVNGIQAARGRLAGLAPELRRSFLADKRRTYTALADALIAADRLPEAQEALSMLKEDELLDYVVRASAGDAAASRIGFVGPAELAAQQRWQAIGARLAALGAEAAELARRARLGLSPQEQARRQQIDAELAAANAEFDRFLAELAREFASAGTPKGAPARQDQARQDPSLQGLLAALGRDAALLHYVVAEQRVAILLTTADGQVGRHAPVPAAALGRKVLAFRQALLRREDVRPAARELHALLVEPVASELRRAGVRTLMLSLDGALRYLPFAALHDGQGWLAERFALAIYTDAARAQLLRPPARPQAVTGMGLTRAVPGFAALPAVRQEFEAIRGSVREGDIFLDEQFTAERLRTSLARPHPLVHIASHFQFRPGTYANSFLVMGDGSRMSLQEFRDRRLRFADVDQLTLSACDTAMGGGLDETGAEVEGFGALAQQQGAASVLATLWPVADASTARFMALAYDGRMADPRAGKAEALRRAQQAFIGGGAGIEGRWSHPFYWAAYVLMGHWR